MNSNKMKHSTYNVLLKRIFKKKNLNEIDEKHILIIYLHNEIDDQ